MSCCNCGNTSTVSGCCPQCAECAAPSAANESLESSLDNFIKSFYGTVGKTLVNGQVEWTLPCNLDTGLVGNPRVADEGLACYFLRLFNDGIYGLAGEPGPAGETGAAGESGFTTVATAFSAPSVNSDFSFYVVSDVILSAGMILYVARLGWVRVVSLAGTLVYGNYISASASPLAVIPAGASVTVAGPTGAVGLSIPGPAGPTGPTGPAGAAGAPGIATNVHAIQTYAAGSYSPSPTAAEYLLCNAVAGAVAIGLPAVVDCVPGKMYVIKKIDVSANAVTITPNAGEALDGVVNDTLSIGTPYTSISVITDGSNWFIV